MNKEVLFFSSTTCVPCKTIYPVVKEICENNGIKLTKKDVEANGQESSMYSVRSVPAVIVLIDGNHIGRMIIGAKSKADFEKLILA